MQYRIYDRHINKHTRGKWDVSPLTADAVIFRSLIIDLLRPFPRASYDKVVAPEAMGWLFGSAAALHARKGLVVLRKDHALPTIRSRVATTRFIDYSGDEKRLEINRGALRRGERVLLLDDWIETGAHIVAAIRLIERQGARISGICAISAHRNAATQHLFAEHNLHALRVVEDGRSRNQKR